MDPKIAPQYYLQKKIKEVLSRKELNESDVETLIERVKVFLKSFRDEFNEEHPLTENQEDIISRNNEIANLKSKYIFSDYYRYITEKEVNLGVQDRCFFIDNKRTIRNFLKKDFMVKKEYRVTEILDFLSIALGFYCWSEACKYNFDILKKPIKDKSKKENLKTNKEILDAIEKFYLESYKQILDLKDAILKISKQPVRINENQEKKKEINNLKNKINTIREESSDNFKILRCIQDKNAELILDNQFEINFHLENLTRDLRKLEDIDSKISELHSIIVHKGIKIDYIGLNNANLTKDKFTNHNVNFSEFIVNAIECGINLKFSKFLYEEKQKSEDAYNIMRSLLHSYYKNIYIQNSTNFYLSRLGLKTNKKEWDSNFYSNLINQNIKSTLVLDFIKLGFIIGEAMTFEMVLDVLSDETQSNETLDHILTNELKIQKYLSYHDLEYLYSDYYPKIRGYKKSEYSINNSNILEFLIRIKQAVREKYSSKENTAKYDNKISNFIYEIFILGRDIQCLEFYHNQKEDDNDVVFRLKEFIKSFSIEETMEERVKYLGFSYKELYDSIYEYYSLQIDSPFLLGFLRMGYLTAKDTLFSIGFVGQEIDEYFESSLKIRNEAFKEIKLLFIEYNLLDFFEKEYPNIIVKNNIFELENDIDVFVYKMKSVLNSSF